MHQAQSPQQDQEMMQAVLKLQKQQQQHTPKSQQSTNLDLCQ
jgi:hypothetical protein